MISKIQISVAICTYNGEKRIPEVLESLSLQEGLKPDEWEILLIDNASTDDTKQVFKLFAQQHPTLLCRYVYESVPGQSAARLCAMKEVLGAWICFVDDDNILDKRYLAAAINFARSNPNIGAFGGRSIARLAVSPPEWFSAIKTGLAIWDVIEKPHQLAIGERSFTAGLVVNTEAARKVAAETWIMTGRTKDFPIGGEDFELCLKISRIGKELWYIPELVFEHVIPENRLQLGYLKDLFATFGATHLLLYPIYHPCHNSRFLTISKILLSAVIKILPLFILSIIDQENKWIFKRRCWTYIGVIIHSSYAIRRLIHY